MIFLWTSRAWRGICFRNTGLVLAPCWGLSRSGGKKCFYLIPKIFSVKQELQPFAECKELYSWLKWLKEDKFQNRYSWDIHMEKRTTEERRTARQQWGIVDIDHESVVVCSVFFFY